MKKFVAALLVLTMAVALAATAMASCDIKADMWVEFKRDSAAPPPTPQPNPARRPRTWCRRAPTPTATRSAASMPG